MLSVAIAAVAIYLVTTCRTRAISKPSLFRAGVGKADLLALTIAGVSEPSQDRYQIALYSIPPEFLGGTSWILRRALSIDLDRRIAVAVPIPSAFPIRRQLTS